MNNPYPFATSYFLGLSLSPEPCVPLFVALQKYIAQQNIGSAIELVNPLSLHITLCYFPSDLPENTLEWLK